MHYDVKEEKIRCIYFWEQKLKLIFFSKRYAMTKVWLAEFQGTWEQWVDDNNDGFITVYLYKILGNSWERFWYQLLSIKVQNIYNYRSSEQNIYTIENLNKIVLILPIQKYAIICTDTFAIPFIFHCTKNTALRF